MGQPAQTTQPDVGGLRLWPYEIERVVAPSGENGVVLAARTGMSSGHPHPVALTVFDAYAMARPIHDTMMRRFQVTASLHHPTLLPALDSGLRRGLLYVATPWVDGWDLEAVVARLREVDESTSPRLVASLGVELAEALAFLHERTDGTPDGTLVHGRVAPRRVMFMRTGNVKLLGFPGASASVDVLAPPPHDRRAIAESAPEILLGELPTPRTDVYNLCLTLLSIVLGENPLLREDAEATRAAVLAGASAPEGLPPSLVAVLMRGLAVRPEDRPMSARWLAIGFSQLLGSLGGPVLPSEMRATLHDLFPAGSTSVVPGRLEEATALFERLVERFTTDPTEEVELPGADVSPPAVPSAWRGAVGIVAWAIAAAVFTGWAVQDPAGPSPVGVVAAAAAPTAPGPGALLDQAEQDWRAGREAAALEGVERAAALAQDAPTRARAEGLRDQISIELDVQAVRRLLELGSLDEAEARLAPLRARALDNPTLQSLDERLAAARSATVAPAPTALPRVAQPRSSVAVAPASPARGAATLELTSSAAAVVYLDGRPIGTTPISGWTVDPGPHEVVFRRGGVPDVKKEVTVAAGQRVVVEGPSGAPAAATPAPAGALATLALRSRPSAVVYVDGVAIGTTPHDAQVPLGHHKVEFRLGGHDTIARNIDVRGAMDMTVELQPVATAGASP